MPGPSWIAGFVYIGDENFLSFDDDFAPMLVLLAELLLRVAAACVLGTRLHPSLSDRRKPPPR